MGLLDEAIREHLELKRRHGADPQQIAREEHEVLNPIEFGVEPPAWAQGPGELSAAGSPPALGSPFDGAGAQIEQETLEVDMAAVIAQGEGVSEQEPPGEAPLEQDPPAGPIRARRITGAAEPGELAEDFEWEVPARGAPGAEQPGPAPQGSYALE